MNKFAPAILAVLTALSVFGEAPFAFKSRLTTVHATDRRDYALTAAADEFAFVDGAIIEIETGCPSLVRRAAEDFADYLVVSMGVNASVRQRGDRIQPGLTKTVSIACGRRGERGYSVEVTREGVAVDAANDRMAAQALYHLEDLMNLRRGPFLKTGREDRRPIFDNRITFAGFGNCVAPDAHLNQLAHYGFTCIEVWLADYDVISQGVRQDVNDLIERAARYGLDVYLEPRNRAYVHPSDPQATAAYDAAYGAMARYYPKALGGMYCGEVCEFPSKDPQTNGGDHLHRKPEDAASGLPYPGWFPCSDWADWAKAVGGILHRYNSDYHFVFCTYNWGGKDERARADLIAALPKSVLLMPTFETGGEIVKRNGLRVPVADYSLASIGPGEYFRSEAAQAKAGGIRLWSNCNSAGLSWDYGNIPYQPAPWTWRKRWAALVKAHHDYNLSGLRESHEYAWYPSFISELEKEMVWEGGIDFERHLRMIAVRDFGAANADDALEAWKLWSRAAEDYVPTDDNQYGPCRIGAAYPYNFGGAELQQGWDVPAGFPLDDGAVFRICWFDYGKPIAGLGTAALGLDEQSEQRELELFESMVKDYDAGAERFRKIAAHLPEGRRDAAVRQWALGRYLKCATRTALNVKLGLRAWRAGRKDEVRRIAKLEYANALEALEAVDADSRLGWLVSSGYTGGRAQIEWKLRKMRELYGESIGGKR